MDENQRQFFLALQKLCCMHGVGITAEVEEENEYLLFEFDSQRIDFRATYFGEFGSDIEKR